MPHELPHRPNEGRRDERRRDRPRAGGSTPRPPVGRDPHRGARAAGVIVPELQGLAVGDRVPDSRDWSVFFTVVALEPEGAGATRLLIRARGDAEPWYARLALGWVIGIGGFEIGAFAVNRRQRVAPLLSRREAAPTT